MGKKIKRLSCVLLAIVMCMGMTVPVMAASSKYNAAVASYKRYMRGKCGSYLIVDIDGNGVPELLFHNTTGWYNEIRSYNTRTKKHANEVFKTLPYSYITKCQYWWWQGSYLQSQRNKSQ